MFAHKTLSEQFNKGIFKNRHDVVCALRSATSDGSGGHDDCVESKTINSPRTPDKKAEINLIPSRLFEQSGIIFPGSKGAEDVGKQAKEKSKQVWEKLWKF